MALNQCAEQSSTAHSWQAQNAVDGNPAKPGASVGQLGETCTRTQDRKADEWWMVTFSRAVKIHSFVIYNRRRDQPVDIDDGESKVAGVKYTHLGLDWVSSGEF